MRAKLEDKLQTKEGALAAEIKKVHERLMAHSHGIDPKLVKVITGASTDCRIRIPVELDHANSI